MFKKILKFSKIILYIVKAKKVWRPPQKADILIFDACGQEFLFECLKGKSFEVLSTRGEQINLFVLLVSLLFFRPGAQGYIDSYIKIVRPKLIITYIDNTAAFYEIKKRNPLVSTLFIQNGWRSYYGDIFEDLNKKTDSINRSVDYMLCFGKAIGDHYQKYVRGNALSVGSLRNNLYSYRFDKKNGVVAFISQWTESGLDVDGVRYPQSHVSGAVDKKVLEFLLTFCRTKKLFFYIIPRTKFNNPDRKLETEYFSKILGDAYSYLEFDEPGTSYRAIDEAEIIVGIDSTLAYESLARGNKTAIFSIRGNSLEVGGLSFGWPGVFADDGFFWTNYFSNMVFDRIMNNLLCCNDDEWAIELSKINMSELMIFDPGNQIIKNIIDEIIV